MSLLENDAQHMAWMKSADVLKKALKQIQTRTKIEEQRSSFSTLSNELRDVVKVFGVDPGADKKLYLMFCPMANGNTGGIWFSDEKEIENPYYGQAMLRCGEVRETLGGEG